MKSDTPHRPGGVQPTAAGNLVPWLYLTVCAAVLVWALSDQVAVGHADAGFSTIWPLLLTLPCSLVVLVLPTESPATYAAAVAAGAAVNAWVVARLLRKAGDGEGE